MHHPTSSHIRLPCLIRYLLCSPYLQHLSSLYYNTEIEYKARQCKVLCSKRKLWFVFSKPLMSGRIPLQLIFLKKIPSHSSLGELSEAANVQCRNTAKAHHKNYSCFFFALIQLFVIPLHGAQRGYGSGLPLPLAGHGLAFTGIPLSYPRTTVSVIVGVSQQLLLPKSAKNKRERNKGKRYILSGPPPPLPSSGEVSNPSLTSTPPASSVSWVAGLALGSLAPYVVGAAISHRALLVLPTPLGGIGPLVPACWSTREV